MSKKPTKLPALTNLEAIKEALDVRLGRRGDKLDKAVTFRDLQGTGKFGARLRGGDVELYPELPGGSGGEDVDLETWVPSAPTGFVAKSMFGGIFLKWDWPPHFGAIGYTEVYRAASNDASQRELLIVGDRLSYVDKIDGTDETEYFYWIRFRSLGDIVGPFTGPVSAVSLRPVKDIIDDIEDDIKGTDAYKDIMEDIVPFDEQFADDISRLEDRVDAIKARITARISAIKQAVAAKHQAIKTSLAAKVLDPNSITDEHVDTYMNMAGVNSQAAFALADTANSSAAIANEGVVKLETLDISPDSALYTRFSNIDLAVGDAQGAITDIVNLNISRNSALYTRFSNIDLAVGDAQGAITNIIDLNISRNSALYTRFNDIQLEVDDAFGKIRDIVSLDISTNSALFTKLRQTEVSANDASATADSILNLGAGVNGTAFAEFVEAMSVTDRYGNYARFQETKSLAEDLSGEYSIKLDNNGHVAGFGLYNTTGQGSSFVVRADKFYVVDQYGNGGSNTPFTVQNGNTYIRSAFIEEGFVDDLTTNVLVATETYLSEAYIDWAQITNVDIVSADIKNGTIINAHIKNAAIDTLKIDGDAVTVPEGYFAPWATNGSTSANTIASKSVFMRHSGRINIVFSCRQGYSSGERWTDFELEVKKDSGSWRSYYKGRSGSFQDFVSFSYTLSASSGSRYYARVRWKAEDSSVAAGFRNLTITGLKR